MTFQKISFMNS